MAERRWECITDDVLDGLPPDALQAIGQLAQELAVRESLKLISLASSRPVIGTQSPRW